MNWWPSLLGWPALMISLAMAAIGIVHRKWVFFIVSVALLLPVSFYFLGAPRVGWIALLPPLLLSASAVAVWKQKTALAWVLLIPVIVAAVWLAVLFVGPGKA